MSTQPQDPQRLKALEIAVHARREALSDDDRRFLERALEADPALRAEVNEMTAFLGGLEPARVGARPEFAGRLRAAVADWGSNSQALSFEASSVSTAGSRNPLVNGWRWLFGRDPEQRDASWSTLLLGRSLAVYVGAASVVCAFLLLRSPSPAPEAPPSDRAQHPQELEHWVPRSPTRDREDLGGSSDGK